MRATRAANTEVLALYWSIGRDVLAPQSEDGWGAKVIERLADDLRAAFPDQRGWSRRNLQYMRAMTAAWPVASIADFVQQPVARLPWGHVTVLLTRLGDTTTRDWYAVRAAEHGWSRAVMEHQVTGALHTRAGAAPSNSTAHLPAVDSERASERELEQALMDRLQQTLQALGHGMAFVGRQVRFDVDGDTYTLDLPSTSSSCATSSSSSSAVPSTPATSAS